MEFNIFFCHILSEAFIREFKDEVDWKCISIRQTLSEELIREFKDRVDCFCISKHQDLSDDFKEEFKEYIHKELILIP